MRTNWLLKTTTGNKALFLGGAICGLLIAGFVMHLTVSGAADKGIDADIVPSVSGSLGIGTGGFGWSTINDTVYFNGSLVGIGMSPTARELETAGGMRLATDKPRPACASGVRGLWWYSNSGSGAKDVLAVCTKDAADSYSWRTVY